jgi:hypothetical protein
MSMEPNKFEIQIKRSWMLREIKPSAMAWDDRQHAFYNEEKQK